MRRAGLLLAVVILALGGCASASSSEPAGAAGAAGSAAPVCPGLSALASGLALWPAQKNLGTLLSCSAAVMLATQFWHAQQGGLCMAWYLPLLILTIFRPNLEDRVALSAVRPLWRRKA